MLHVENQAVERIREPGNEAVGVYSIYLQYVW